MALILFLGVLALAGIQLVAGFVGISDGLGVGWAIAALAACLLLRFTLPITIGAFFGATNVWGWHWVFAVLLVLPGLLVIIPGALYSMTASLYKKVS